jgi:hypothetical protein
MDLVDRYLKAVSLLLPKAQREDIVAELRDTILSRIEAQEAELGRPLKEAEIEAELHAIGHPLEVAARYRDGPNHLVGPTLYPYYVFVLKVALTLQLGVAGVVFIVHLFTADGDLGAAFAVALRSAINGAVTLVGIATITAVLLERYQPKLKLMENWKVRNLPLLELGSWDFTSLAERLGHPDRSHTQPGGNGWRRYRNRYNPLAYIAGGAVLGLWWIGAIHFVGPESAAMMRSPEFGPFAAVDWLALKEAVYAPVLAYSVGLIGVGVVIFAWPNAHRVQAFARLVLACIGMSIFLIACFDSPLTPIVAISSTDDVIVRIQALLRGHDPHLVLDFVALIFLLNVLIGVQAILAALWGVLAGDTDRRSSTPE